MRTFIRQKYQLTKIVSVAEKKDRRQEMKLVHKTIRTVKNIVGSKTPHNQYGSYKNEICLTAFFKLKTHVLCEYLIQVQKVIYFRTFDFRSLGS